MTEHPLQFIRKGDQSVPKPPAKHPLGALDSSRFAKYLVLFRADDGAIEGLLNIARTHIPGMTTSAIVRRVVQHNPNCVWAIARKRKFDADAPTGEGFIAMLPLNAKGLQLLALNLFNAVDPDLSTIARPGEKPAGIYIWAIYAPGRLVGAVSLFMDQIAAAPFDGVNLYTRPNTPDGFRFNETIGLKKNPIIGAIQAPHLYEFRRAPQKLPIYDSHRRGAKKTELSVSVARSFEDLMRVLSIRGAVYIGEQECPYEEEFDGNDMAATHLLGFVGDEPAGCIRIRYFADFAKIERLAVRKEFRKTRLSTHLARATVELCRMKGYGRLYAHAQKRLTNFYTRFGFRVLENGREIVFSDFDYVEMVADVVPHPDAITFGTDPYKLIRPEGRWHVPGILEQSSIRDATRPSIDR